MYKMGYFFFFFFFLGGGGLLLKFRIFWGMSHIPDIFGVNSRCWVQAYVSRKMRLQPHPGIKVSQNRHSHFHLSFDFVIAKTSPLHI